MPLEASERGERNLLIAYVVLVVITLGIAYSASNTAAAPILTMWLLGAAALGLVSGFTTGASEQAGAAAQLIAFISGGVMVPILGGVATLLKQPETTTETNTYSGEQLLQKITAITATSQASELHPLWVAGSFFAVYSIFAIIGVAVGVRRRNGTVGRKPGGIKLAPPARQHRAWSSAG